METTKYENFAKLDLRVVKIKSVNKVEGSEKLLQLVVDMGGEERQIIAGIGKSYSPEEIISRNIVVVANLEPRTLMGLESQGMLLAASSENDDNNKKVVLLTTMDDIDAGSSVG